jgi:hypothetical protein
MSGEFQLVFKRLRHILEEHGAGLAVGADTSKHYGLEAPVGPATVRAWGGKQKHPTIPVAWVKVGKAYVSYHLMGVYCDRALLAGCTKQLRARMQGKSCFNFSALNESLFKELEELTIKSIRGMERGGFILRADSP